MQLEWGLIGSCTNSSYEDLSRAASIAKQAVDKGLATKAEFGINPGSEQVRYTAERDGLLSVFEDLDAKIFTNACGPCIGQWAREGAEKEEKTPLFIRLIETFLNARTESKHPRFVASPEMVAAVAIAGRLDFNPLTDKLINQNGEEVTLDPPTGLELPPKGFDVEDNGYLAPEEDGAGVEVVVKEDSERLQLLTPFNPWDGENLNGQNF